MSDVITEARDLIQQAKSKEKCLDKATAVERALEDLKSAAGAGRWQRITGGVLMGIGAVTVIATWWTGVGGAVGTGVFGAGVGTVAGGLAVKADAMEKAMKDLKRAIEDLKKCLG